MGNIQPDTYLYVRRDRTCYLTDNLIYPGWRDLHIIYDRNTGRYLNEELWPRSDDEPEWADPEEV